MNPLLQHFETPFQTPPFEEIKNEHFEPAIDEALAQAREELKAITKNVEEATFANTIEALEANGRLLERISEIFFNLNSAETNDEIQAIARRISPKLTAYSNDVMLNEALFTRVEYVYAHTDKAALSTEEAMLLEKTYRSFVRNGAQLPDKEKSQLRQIDTELAQLSLQFGENVLAETNAFQMWLDDVEDLQGLPESAVEAAAEAANEAGSPGRYLFTLHFPSYIPFVTYASKRNLREKMVRAYGARAFRSEDRDNREIVKRIANLRAQRAQLLGFDTHAHYVLQERMAEHPDKVKNFLNELLEAALPAARREVEEVTEFAHSLDGLQQLQKWDFAYYTEKLKQKRFEIDDEVLKPYFQLEKVIAGVFEVAQKLYGLQFVERNDIQKYHPDVKTYEVLDADGSHLSVFYADFFPRAGKRNGAWMTSYRNQRMEGGKDIRPIISIVCNFTKPTSKNPSLLTFNEVTTLFHEFGHALHGILAKGKYGSLSGTHVYWDFVELPSQIMENWCYQKDCLDLFAVHYKTGKKIPQELVEKLRASSTFMEGYASVRQVGLGRLDLAWHAEKGREDWDVDSYEREVLSQTELLPWIDSSNTSTSFSHIFQGGYSAGYYSYKWAEVLDADAFEYFLESGIFNSTVASKFRALLSAGGSEHPSVLYRRFRGKDPDPKALLRRAGLLQE